MGWKGGFLPVGTEDMTPWVRGAKIAELLAMSIHRWKYPIRLHVMILPHLNSRQLAAAWILHNLRLAVQI